jgi:hypothetical protein
MARRWTAALLVAIAFALAGCLPAVDPQAPVPQALIPAASAPTRLVVVLPGRGDDVQALRESGIAPAIQSAWPDADVVLTGLGFGYYMQGRAPQRLHDEVIVPARARGYREVWLLGASMGGMGTLMYDRAYPGDADGLVLLAPYLGDRKLLDEIRTRGLGQWEAGPVPAEVDAGNYQRELWRHLQGWRGNPARTRSVWLGYGAEDRLAEAMPPLAGLLPQDHVVVAEGGHAWTVWSPLTKRLLEEAGRQRVDTQRSP